jgi:hypothetical protein
MQEDWERSVIEAAMKTRSPRDGWDFDEHFPTKTEYQAREGEAEEKGKKKKSV